MGDETVIDLKREMKRCPECDQRFGPEALFCPFDGTRLNATSWDPSGDTLIGSIVDRYEVCSVLGEGGMGTVYRVRHVALDRYFAMKVLRKDLAREADLSARFTQEARATAIIKHPNVVAITDFGHLKDETPYFVMELLVGHPLSTAIKGGAIEPGVAVRIILKIASALAAAHEAGVVHRDLKPENVFLVVPAGAKLEASDVRIVDFGAAMVMGASRLTKAGIVFGTPHYMSPEQAAGETVDHRTDIYALGVIMYEMFTGRVPFEADTYMGVLTQHMFVNPAPPSQVAPERAEELGALEDVTLRALEKKPEMRFSSMTDFHREVERLVRFEENGQIRVSPAEATKRPSTRPQPAVLPKRSASDRLPTPEEAESIAQPPITTLPVRVFLFGGALIALGSAVVLLTRPSPAPLSPPPMAATAVELPSPSNAPGAIPPPQPVLARTVRVTSIPPAEVWLASARVGATPLDLAVSGDIPARRYTLRQVGYEDRELMVDADAQPTLDVELRKTRTLNAAAPVQGWPRSVATVLPQALPQASSTAPQPTTPKHGAFGADFNDPWKK